MENQIRRRRSCNTDVKATKEINLEKALKTLEEDSSLIIYRPALNKITGSVNATILLQQIYHRWKYNRKEPFYKFKSPCNHRLCKERDSWCEELGFTESEFDTALKKIAHKTTKNIQTGDNKIVYYWTTRDRLTFYSINNLRNNSLPKQDNQVLENQINEVTKTRELSLDYNTKITSEITSKNNIYTRFLEEWNKNRIIIHKKITSKRKTVIDKILKLNDYTQEEIFKSFQNYATVLQSPDYFWDYTWSMEDFLKRGLDRFVDEALPLTTFKNKFKNQTNSQPIQQIQKSNPTKESLNLFSNEEIETWVEEYESLTNLLANADIWPPNYCPDKDKIYSALLEIKNWKNNMTHTDYSQVRRVTGSVRIICNNYIDWIDRQSWLDDGIKEGSLFPSSKMFKQHFIPDLEGDILDIALRSKGWGRDEDLKMESVLEIEAREKQEAEHKREQKETERINAENRKANILWMHSCMKKHLLDLEGIGVIDISKWQDDLNKSEFEKIVIAIEKKHQEEPTNRGNSYRFLFSRTN